MIQILAKPVNEKARAGIRTRVEKFKKSHGRVPKLVVMIVGEDPASVIYTTKKGEAAVAAGMEHETIKFPKTATPEEVEKTVKRLNEDPNVDGILIQRPLPASFEEEKLIYWIAPEKDVDAFHPTNVGLLSLGKPRFLPCTPAGVMLLLEHYGIDPSGKLACVIGRSSIVGKPMAALLLQANATVIQCHSKTRNLAMLSRQADILIVAAGNPTMINASHVKEGATVIDVGIHRTKDGKICGDVDYEAVSQVANAVTPVPGGVGPMTITMLLENTLAAAEKREQ